MDELDIALLEAWERATKAPRVQMAKGPKSERPLRAWCVCVRASDRRINSNCAEVWPFKDLPEYGEDHWVRLEAGAIRELVRPVVLDWPGVPLRVAAGRLGRSYQSALEWMKAGVFEVAYAKAGTARCGRGKRVPMVWARSPLDPNMEMGRGPAACFGTMWQWHHERVPDGAVLEARRVVRMGGRDRRGWRFVCQGIGGRECGKEVNGLYLPLRVWGRGRRWERAAVGRWAVGNRKRGRSADRWVAGMWMVEGMGVARLRVVGVMGFGTSRCWGRRGGMFLCRTSRVGCCMGGMWRGRRG